MQRPLQPQPHPQGATHLSPPAQTCTAQRRSPCWYQAQGGEAACLLAGIQMLFRVRVYCVSISVARASSLCWAFQGTLPCRLLDFSRQAAPSLQTSAHEKICAYQCTSLLTIASYMCSCGEASSQSTANCLLVKSSNDCRYGRSRGSRLQNAKQPSLLGGSGEWHSGAQSDSSLSEGSCPGQFSQEHFQQMQVHRNWRKKSRPIACGIIERCNAFSHHQKPVNLQ